MEFSKLTPDIKKKLLKLISRIMERSYRRGVQQALHMKDEGIIDSWILDDPHKFRYGKSISVSIGLDGFTTPALERLEMEEHLSTIGLT